jgi:hypothetical protein
MARPHATLMILGGLLWTATPAMGQEEPPPRPQWERRSPPTQAPVSVFHSTQGLNFPTAETLDRGEFQFEISHRFIPPVSDAEKSLLGLDGPVNLRLGLGYAVTDRITATLQRSNREDNLDLNLKAHLWSFSSDRFPAMLGIQGGAAWNGELPEVTPEPDPWQYYAMIIWNQGIGERVALGVIPAYLRNPDVRAEDPDNAFSLGLHGQWYIGERWSVLGEWNFSEPWDEDTYDAGSFGVELETGGHFFKLLLTNSVALNPTQFLAGTKYKFEPSEWRLGFNITRVFSF